MRPDTAALARTLSAAGLKGIEIDDVPSLGVVIHASAAHARPVLSALKASDDGFEFLVDLFGIDTTEAVDVVYHLRSFARDEEVFVKVDLDYGSDLASVWDLFPAALMPERECAEMFGLTLSGHPNPKHLLLTEGSKPFLLKQHLIRTPEEVRNR
ncbi:MAG: NADH-quinone oxidoreductase subunit C [Coriobacteriia bacterium]|nr:NADH-quinone oxidoreductase subunit C [Coriobacteriia bacterium]